MNEEKVRELAFQLLDVSFDTAEWEEEFLENSISEVAEQLNSLKQKKEARTVFDTTIDLWDLLSELYDRNIIHDALLE